MHDGGRRGLAQQQCGLAAAIGRNHPHVADRGRAAGRVRLRVENVRSVQPFDLFVDEAALGNRRVGERCEVEDVEPPMRQSGPCLALLERDTRVVRRERRAGLKRWGQDMDLAESFFKDICEHPEPKPAVV